MRSRHRSIGEIRSRQSRVAGQRRPRTSFRFAEVGFKLPELVLITTKSEAWPLQECAAAIFKQQPTMAWDAKGLSDEADHDLLIQKVSPILILCAAHLKSWAVPCGKHYQPNICAMLTVWLVSVQNHCVGSYGRACSANDTFKALQNAGNPPPALPQAAPAMPGSDVPAPAPSPTTTKSAAQTIRGALLKRMARRFSDARVVRSAAKRSGADACHG